MILVILKTIYDVDEDVGDHHDHQHNHHPDQQKPHHDHDHHGSRISSVLGGG